MDEQAKAAKLRIAAETRLKEKLADSFKGMDSSELPRLVHELQVHQIELEIQNEELRSAQKALEEARDNYFDLYELAPIGYITLNRESSIGSINLTAAKMLGVDRSKLMFRGFSDFISTQDKNRWYDQFLGIMSHPPGMALSFELEMVRADGASFQAHVECLRREDTESPSVFRLAIFDVSKAKRIEADLRVAAAAFEAQEGILVTDANGDILRVNQAFRTITGYSSEDVIGKNPNILQSGRQDAGFYAAMWQSIHSTGGWSGEIWNKRKNGDIYPEHLAITAVKDADGAVINYVATLTDITMSKAAADTIQRMAFYDSLTGLPNRQLLLDRLRQALASSTRTGKQGALLIIDLDNFKNIKATLGHDVGDLLIKQVADRLLASVREGDTVARLGGDEFVVLLEDLSELEHEAAEQAEVVGEKILAILNQPYQLASREFHNSPSIGAALFGDHSAGIDEFLKQADIAMYQAKSVGKNTLRFFDPQIQATMSVRVALEDAMHKALELDQFHLYYQVQVDSAGSPRGAEVLIRWIHPEHGLVSPASFIPLAEETGMILPIGQWVLETACAQIQAWQQEAITRDLALSVNVSAKQFHQADFVALVQKAVNMHGINPGQLKLELTEGMLVQNIEDTIEKMSVLNEIGIKFSLDDFGTGFSSLQYLKRLPLDQLKIDQSFVRDIVSDANDQAIVSTIIGMSHSLGLNVIAEGVETEEQKEILFNSGCSCYQGYLFSKPVPIEQFEALLKKS